MKSNFKIFIIIRFSINFKKQAWDFQKLDFRFKLFENICLYSLLKQRSKENLHVILMISDDFPKDYMIRLNEMIKRHTFIHIEIFKNNKLEFLQKYIDPYTKIIATVRLDDDDALHPEFVTKISGYCQPEYDNHIISFPLGYNIRIAENIRYKRFSSPLIAVGLTLISKVPHKISIYNENHKKWEKIGFKCIYDRSQIMYVFTNHFYGMEGRFQKNSGFRELTEKFKQMVNYINFDNLGEICSHKVYQLK